MDTLIHEEELCQAQCEDQACGKARMPYVRPMTEVVSIAGGEMLQLAMASQKDYGDGGDGGFLEDDDLGDGLFSGDYGNGGEGGFWD